MSPLKEAFPEDPILNFTSTLHTHSLALYAPSLPFPFSLGTYHHPTLLPIAFIAERFLLAQQAATTSVLVLAPPDRKASPWDPGSKSEDFK